MLNLLYSKVIVPYCIAAIAHLCGVVIISLRLINSCCIQNVYRKIFDFPKKSSAIAMYARYNICRFKSILRKSIYSFKQRLESSTNSIICTLYNSWLIINLESLDKVVVYYSVANEFY